VIVSGAYKYSKKVKDAFDAATFGYNEPKRLRGTVDALAKVAFMIPRGIELVEDERMENNVLQFETDISAAEVIFNSFTI
jgi:hypothetical protein